MAAKKTNKKATIKPLGDRVLLEPISLEEDTGKTASGIILPDTIDKERPEMGKVVAVGEGNVRDNGEVTPMTVKKGDRVIFAKFGPEEVTIDGEEYLIVSESNILAIVE